MNEVHTNLDVFGWLKSGFNAGTLITVATIAAGFATTHGRDEQRMNDLERRIAAFETNGVRRGEMDVRDKSIVEVLQSIDTRLSTIERVLMESRR